jgi:nucleotide-binding universal stress UspA family protein
MRTKSSSKAEHVSPSESAGESSCDKTSNESILSRKFGLKRILVPIDFSNCSLGAFNYAVGLAAKCDAGLVLLHVVEPTVYAQDDLGTTAALEKATGNLMNSGRERLAALQRRATSQGLAVEMLVRMGRAQSEISDTAEATGSDLIVMGTHGYSGLKHLLLGSTAERVVRHAACPVLTVRGS